ncbi:MAG TPA: hypothetical protein VGX96_19655 [Candidatus Elarobacter sp.]|jgi:hypothetical protein|nr:hypothetical protein [Candidatus Elarobacter sp.]
MISAVSALTLTAAPQSLALPPYIAAVTANDPDADGDNDRGTIVDTFA